jgi:hypothetical protein
MTESSNGSPSESKGVAFTNWLVSRATGALEKRSSRRGFLIGSAMAGSAVAVAGCVPITQPGPPYTHITDCAGSFCNDGYTEFCCALTGGLNVCPTDSFAGGWWRADFSSFCNGTRYYIDCMQYCSGPLTGYQNFCASSQECRCANGCDTRKVYCNYFRYGQCHVDDQPTSGPIACRIVTCVPPYTVAEWNCSTTAAVDNSTAEHAGHCPAPPPPPPFAAVNPSSGSAVQDGSRLTAFVRGLDGGVYFVTNQNGVWDGWQSLGGGTSSGVASAVYGATTYVVVRGNDRRIYGNRRDGSTWSGWHQIDGGCNSDPVLISDSTGIVMFVRGTDNSVYANRFNGTTWTGWRGGGGAIDSEPMAGWDQGGTLHVVARSPDTNVYANHFVGSSFTGWNTLSTLGASNPSVVGTASATYVFNRAIDKTMQWALYNGGTWSNWATLGGQWTSDPIGWVDGSGVHVVARGNDASLYHNRLQNGAWIGWMNLGGVITADPVVSTGALGTYLFSRGQGDLIHGILAGDVFSGWVSLGGGVSLARAAP